MDAHRGERSLRSRRLRTKFIGWMWLCILLETSNTLMLFIKTFTISNTAYLVLRGLLANTRMILKLYKK